MAIKGALVAFLLVGFSEYVVSNNECPPRENITDSCRCKVDDDALEVSCRGYNSEYGIEDYVKELQKSFAEKKNIELSFTAFTKESRLSSTLFEGLHIKELEIKKCYVTRWADSEGGLGFIGLDDSLKELEIQQGFRKPENHNDTSSPAPMSIAHLHKLRKVKYYDNYIPTLGFDWFGNGPPSIKELKILLCGTEVIDDHAFAGLLSLKHIEVRANRIERLTRSMFPMPAVNLKEFDFASNRLMDLPEDLFTEMPALKKVQLQGNLLNHISETMWRGVWSKLKYVQLDSNQIDCNGEENAWIFEVKSPKVLHGTCYDGINEKDLAELIKEKRRRG